METPKTEKKTSDVKEVAAKAEPAAKTSSAADKKVKSAKASPKTVKNTAAKENSKASKEKAVPAEKKSPAKSTSSIYVQYYGKEVDTSTLIESAKAAYKESGYTDAIKKIDLYVKPEENAAYYVINGDFSGSILI